MKTVLAITCMFLYSHSISQDTVDVVEKTIKISGVSEEKEFYAFAEGDKVIYNFVVDFGKELKDVVISEYPQNIKFADHTTKSIQNKVLNISRNSIYQFVYNNTNLSGRTIKVKIQRIPKSDETKFYNTNVKWINKVDTSYQAFQRSVLIKSDTSFVEVINAASRVHSQTNAAGSKTVVSFTLPPNTTKWTYWIGVGAEGEKSFQADKQKFSITGAKLLGSINPMVGLAFGIFSMSHASLGDNIKYVFLPTYEDATLFKAGQQYKLFKSGNVITDFGVLNYGNKDNQQYFIGLENDNVIDGINVNVKILAVKIDNTYTTVVEKLPRYVNILMPMAEN